MDDHAERAQFRAMTEGTKDDWTTIASHMRVFQRDLPRRVLTHLQLLAGDSSGYPVDRLEHSLQCATRAHRDGRDEPYVVMALLHDIGDTLGTYDHPEIAAAMLRPFLSEELHWVVQQHGIFQGYFYFQHLGFDQDARERYRGHQHFAACAEFCEKYDQASFDPNYNAAPVDFFAPMLERVMSRPLNGLFARVKA